MQLSVMGLQKRTFDPPWQSAAAPSAINWRS
jgi:hypothetical protein